MMIRLSHYLSKYRAYRLAVCLVILGLFGHLLIVASIPYFVCQAVLDALRDVRDEFRCNQRNIRSFIQHERGRLAQERCLDSLFCLVTRIPSRDRWEDCQ